MYLGKYEHFRCDLCGVERFVARFPDGWVWFKTEKCGTVKHACHLCKHEVDEKQRRSGGQIN